MTRGRSAGVAKVAPLKSDALSANANLRIRQLELTLHGTADMRATEPLREWMAAVHQHALENRVKEVCVDFSALEFMNSSCFKTFVSWVVGLGKLSDETRYRITFKPDHASHWQRRSLQSLVALSEGNVSVQSA